MFADTELQMSRILGINFLSIKLKFFKEKIFLLNRLLKISEKYFHVVYRNPPQDTCENKENKFPTKRYSICGRFTLDFCISEKFAEY
jgi:hypothetical protein